MSWNLGVKPEPFAVSCADAEFAMVLVMGGDGDLSRALVPDLEEMMDGVSSSVAALVWIDTPDEGGVVGEVLPGRYRVIESLPEANTGDPRPLSDFFARALVSFSEKTRFALGFWGHGTGVFGDFDPLEVLVKREFRFGVLGSPLPADAVAIDQGLPVKARLSRSLLPDVTSENSLTNREASSALTVAFARAGRSIPVDLLFFDTCLSASVEMFAELRRFARCFVASALPIPESGWNYAFWLKATDKERPASPEDWAFLAAGTFGAAYEQGSGGPAAQLWAFSSEADFFSEFALLVEALKGLGSVGGGLVAQAAGGAEKIVFGENVDFGQLVRGLGVLADSSGLKVLAEGCLAAYEKCLIGASVAPPGGERLLGMTIWCPLSGDLEGVSRYYQRLEFDRLCGWSSLVTSPAVSARGFLLSGFWGLELVEARAVECSVSDGEFLFLAIPLACREFAGGLVEGVYRFHGGAGAIRFLSSQVLEDFVRLLLQVRVGEEFEALRGCLNPGWVIGGAAAGAMVADFDRCEVRFKASLVDPDFALLFDQVRSAMRRVAADGVLLFS